MGVPELDVPVHEVAAADGATTSGAPLSLTTASLLRTKRPCGATRRLHRLPNRSR
jgi:hypothetical protein